MIPSLYYNLRQKYPSKSSVIVIINTIENELHHELELGSVIPRSAPTCIAIPLYRCRVKKMINAHDCISREEAGREGALVKWVTRCQEYPLLQWRCWGRHRHSRLETQPPCTAPPGVPPFLLYARFCWIVVFRVHLSVGPTGQLISPAWWLVTTRTDIFLHKEGEDGVDWTSKKGRYHVVLAHGWVILLFQATLFDF